jgi:hypothetical protein
VTAYMKFLCRLFHDALTIKSWILRAVSVETLVILAYLETVLAKKNHRKQFQYFFFADEG